VLGTAPALLQASLLPQGGLQSLSARFKKLVDKMRPPVAVRWRMSFLEDERNGTAAEKPRLIFRQLAALSARSRITTLELCYNGVFTYPCRIKGQDAERPAGVLAQCPALAHLNLGENQFRTGGAENLARVLIRKTEDDLDCI
jgi:hypothetical protein